jgi:hypothetical protein
MFKPARCNYLASKYNGTQGRGEVPLKKVPVVAELVGQAAIRTRCNGLWGSGELHEAAGSSRLRRFALGEDCSGPVFRLVRTLPSVGLPSQAEGPAGELYRIKTSLRMPLANSDGGVGKSADAGHCPLHPIRPTEPAHPSGPKGPRRSSTRRSRWQQGMH